MKYCPGCQKMLELTPEFWHRRKRSHDGYQRLCKVCHTALVLATRDMDKALAYAKRYRIEHAERIAASRRAYQALHRERLNADRRERYRAKHGEVRQYRLLDPTEKQLAHREYNRRWRASHREELNARQREKQQIKKASLTA